MSRSRFTEFIFAYYFLSIRLANLMWDYTFFDKIHIMIVFTRSRHIVIALISRSSLHGKAFTLLAKPFWRFIGPWSNLASCFLWNYILSITLAYFVGNYTFLSLTIILLILSRSRLVIVILICWFSLHSKALTIFSKSFWGAVGSRTNLIPCLFRNNNLPIALAHLICNNTILDLAQVLIILSWAWHVIIILLSWFTLHRKALSIFSESFRRVVSSRTELAPSFFGYDILPLTLAHLVSKNAILDLAEVLVVLSGTWHIIGGLVGRSSLHSEAFAFFPKLFGRIVLAWSNLPSCLLWDYFLSMALTHFVGNDTILDLAQILVILSWAWHMIIILLSWFTLHRKALSIFAESIWRSVCTWSNLISCFLRHNFLPVTLTHFVSNYALLDLAEVLIVFTRTWNIVNALISRSPLHGKAFTLFTKPHWRFIGPWSHLISCFLWDYFLSMALTHFIGNYAIFNLAQILFIFTWPWHMIAWLVCRSSLHCKALTLFAKSLWWAVGAWSYLTPRLFWDNILPLALAHLVSNYAIFCLFQVIFVFSWTWNIVAALINRFALHSETFGIFAKPIRRMIGSWTDLVSRLFRYNILSVALTHLVGNYTFFSLANVLVILPRPWYSIVVLFWWLSLHGKTFSLFAKSLRWAIMPWPKLIPCLLRYYILSLTLTHFICDHAILGLS